MNICNSIAVEMTYGFLWFFTAWILGIRFSGWIFFVDVHVADVGKGIDGG